MDDATANVIVAAVGLGTALVGVWKDHAARRPIHEPGPSPHGLMRQQQEWPATDPDFGASGHGWQQDHGWSSGTTGGWPPSSTGFDPSPFDGSVRGEPDVQWPSPAPPDGVAIGRALRDAGLIFLTTAVIGFVVGAASSGSDLEELLAIVGALTIVVLLVGFTISAITAPGNRWRHVTVVAGMVAAAGLINVVVGMATFGEWMAGVVLIAVCAAVAGGVAHLVKR